jgi:hydrogenase maturation protein HypF
MLSTQPPMASTRYRAAIRSAMHGVAIRPVVFPFDSALLLGATAVTIASEPEGGSAIGMLDDVAMCADCLREMLDSGDRRYGYPFTNCTACGPRFTITQRLPYDRASTTMRRFQMCEACQAEYDSESSRRYHAPTNACAVCGPKLSLSVDEIVNALCNGSIVALKGDGGFHLFCDAKNASAVDRLRMRKARDAAPLPVMMPSLAVAREYCLTDRDAETALTSPAAPIVLLRQRQPSDLAPNVSGASRFVGALLPYSPLHHLLMRRYGAPLVATAGNPSGEPIATDNVEARQRLAGMADLIVTHNRTIARPCDDSVVRVGATGPSILRRARGYASRPIDVDTDLPRALAVGGHLKNTVAIGVGRRAIVSQHLGDLDTKEARCGFEAAIGDLCRTYAFEPELVVADRHRDYWSRRWAEDCGLRLVEVQHHHAHVAGCAAEHGVAPRYLGVAWGDGALGDDGTVWGGEFFVASPRGFERVAYLRPFRLLDGDATAGEGWRVAASMAWAARSGPVPAGRDRVPDLSAMLTGTAPSRWCTSVGRLFDAVAATAGVCLCNRFDGEAALALEAASDPREHAHYPFGDELIGDWQPMRDAIAADLRHDVPTAIIAARFHQTLVDWICRVADYVQAGPVVLSGESFQNAFLVDRTVAALRARGHTVYAPGLIPPNDGGLSFGQLVLARSAVE